MTGKRKVGGARDKSDLFSLFRFILFHMELFNGRARAVRILRDSFLFCFILSYVEFCGGRETCYSSISRFFYFILFCLHYMEFFGGKETAIWKYFEIFFFFFLIYLFCYICYMEFFYFVLFYFT